MGYDANYLVDPDALPDFLACQICFEAFHDPRESCDNGHIYCRDCLAAWQGAECPGCRQDLGEGFDVDEFAENHAIRRAVDALPAKCIVTEDCKWSGHLVDAARHHARCPFDHRACRFAEEGCEERMPEEDLDGHAAQCDCRPVPCPHADCDEVVRARELPEHLIHCANDPCPNADCTFVDTQQCLIEHRVHCDLQAQRIIALQALVVDQERQSQRAAADHAARMDEAETEHDRRASRTTERHVEELRAVTRQAEDLNRALASVRADASHEKVMSDLRATTLQLQNDTWRIKHQSAEGSADRLRDTVASLERVATLRAETISELRNVNSGLADERTELVTQLAASNATLVDQKAAISKLRAALTHERQQQMHIRSTMRGQINSLKRKLGDRDANDGQRPSSYAPEPAPPYAPQAMQPGAQYSSTPAPPPQPPVAGCPPSYYFWPNP